MHENYDGKNEIVTISLFLSVCVTGCVGSHLQFFWRKFASRLFKKARRQFGGMPPACHPPSLREKNSFLAGQRRLRRSCRSRERDHVGLLCGDRRERNALRLSNAVLSTQVAVGFHRQRAAVLVAQPPADSRNIDAAFYADRRE